MFANRPGSAGYVFWIFFFGFFFKTAGALTFDTARNTASVLRSLRSRHYKHTRTHTWAGRTSGVS